MLFSVFLCAFSVSLCVASPIVVHTRKNKKNKLFNFYTPRRITLFPPAFSLKNNSILSNFVYSKFIGFQFTQVIYRLEDVNDKPNTINTKWTISCLTENTNLFLKVRTTFHYYILSIQIFPLYEFT